jgi:hypothetical protein
MNSPYKEAQFKLTERQRQILRKLVPGNHESTAGLGWRKGLKVHQRV